MARRGYDIDGVRVAQARIALGLTQQQLADDVGLNRVTLTKIENGGRRVSLETLERLAVRLGRTREHLLGEPDQVDELELARDRVANALAKIGEGFEDFSAAVEVLYERAASAGLPAKDKRGGHVR